MNSKQETQVKIFGAFLWTNLSELESCVNLVHSSVPCEEGIWDIAPFWNVCTHLCGRAAVLAAKKPQKDIQKMDD